MKSSHSPCEARGGWGWGACSSNCPAWSFQGDLEGPDIRATAKLTDNRCPLGQRQVRGREPVSPPTNLIWSVAVMLGKVRPLQSPARLLKAARRGGPADGRKILVADGSSWLLRLSKEKRCRPFPHALSGSRSPSSHKGNSWHCGHHSTQASHESERQNMGRGPGVLEKWERPDHGASQP